MKKLIITGIGILGIMFFISCGGADTKPASDTTSAEQPKATTGTTSDYDPKRGEGKFDSTNVTIGPLDAAMAAKGKSVAETKCFSCHKTSDEKLVGPGWKGITERKTPYWIMNFITNPEPMTEKDFGIVILETETEAEALSYMENDPAVKGKLMYAELFDFSLALLRK